jgi:hypothetical protein
MVNKNRVIEMDEYIQELKELHKYAQKNKFTEATRYFDSLLNIFSSEKVDTKKARAMIKEAKEKISSKEILNSFQSQKAQSLYENMRDFFSEHNKFEKFINNVEKNLKARSHGLFAPKPVTSNLSSTTAIQQVLTNSNKPKK